MKTIPVTIQAALDSGTPKLATLWRITRRDGQIFRFTDHNADISQGGLTYLSAISYNRSATADSSGMAPANMEIESVLDDSVITESDLIAGLWDYSLVEIWACLWDNPGAGIYNYRKGRIGQVNNNDYNFNAEFLGITKALEKPAVKPYLPGCLHILGDSNCGVNLATYTVTGTVAAIDSTGLQITDYARTETDNIFAYGLITMTSGDSNGYSMEVKTSDNAGIVTLQQPLPFGISAGDTYSLIKGCDKTKTTCKDTFSNLVNFGGFPDMPGMDKVLQYA